MPLTSVLSLLFLGTPATPPAEAVAFCSVVSKPSLFDRRRISLTARVESDGIHDIVLNEPSCKGALTVDVSGTGKTLDRLNDALYSGGPGTSDKVVEARWTGHLNLSEAVPRLVVESIDEVTVTPIDAGLGK
jgi:hypothetical protein